MNELVKLSIEQVKGKLSDLAGWSFDQSTNEIYKNFEFKGYYKTVAFFNVIAWHAQKVKHHPDVVVGFGKCEVRLTTHDCAGLSVKDFELAHLIENESLAD
jgi:4a-hydroxytetrahydrobiopterin dehydratase